MMCGCIGSLRWSDSEHGAIPNDEKPQVANLIVKVENSVDEFRDYLKRRGENAQSNASNQQSQTRRVPTRGLDRLSESYGSGEER